MKNAYILQTIKPGKEVLEQFYEFCECAKSEKWKFAGVREQELLFAYRHDGKFTTDVIRMGTKYMHQEPRHFGLKSYSRFRIRYVLVEGHSVPFYTAQSQLIEQLAILDLCKIHSDHFGDEFNTDGAGGNNFAWLRQALDAGKISAAF
jgi:hypothetical protein